MARARVLIRPFPGLQHPLTARVLASGHIRFPRQIRWSQSTHEGPSPSANTPPSSPSSNPRPRVASAPSVKDEGVPAWARPAADSLSCRTPATPTTRTGRRGIANLYLELAKPRLSALVVLSAMASYALVPGSAGSVSSLVVLTVGTALCSASANSINMGREPEFDARMTRTRTRPVAAGKLTPKQAFRFAAATGLAGVSVLATGTNPTVAMLGAANIGLYGGLYTTLKRKSIANTWVGAVVGAIPPLMGWATCASLAQPGPWILAGLLYSWQFPHFMALSYAIADEYKRAGYVMSAWTDPLLTARVALRHSIAMFPLCFAASWCGLCDPFFVFDSSIVNAWLVYSSLRFWQQQRALTRGMPFRHSGEHKSWARQLFWASIIHLPVVLVLAMLHKKGNWDWLYEA